MIKSSNCSWVSIIIIIKKKNFYLYPRKTPDKVHSHSEKIKYKFTTILLPNFHNDLYNALLQTIYIQVYTFERIEHFSTNESSLLRSNKNRSLNPVPNSDRNRVSPPSPPKKFNPPPISTWKSRDTGYITRPTCRKFRGGVTKPPPLRNTFVAIVKFNGN